MQAQQKIVDNWSLQITHGGKLFKKCKQSKW